MKTACLFPIVIAVASFASAATAEPINRLFRPEMTRLPTGDQMASVMKRLGVKTQPYGWVLLRCHVDASGTLAPCHVILEAPEPGDVGKLALGLAAYMRAKPATENGRNVDGGSIFVPINIGAMVNTGPFKSAYDAGNPSFAVLPAGDSSPASIKIPCPTDADLTAICPARPIFWSKGMSLEETAPIILGAKQATAFSAVSCRYTAEDRLEDCQIKGEDGPQITESVHKILGALKAPKWSGGENAAVVPTRVTIVFNWTMLTKAAMAITAAQAESP